MAPLNDLLDDGFHTAVESVLEDASFEAPHKFIDEFFGDLALQGIFFDEFDF